MLRAARMLLLCLFSPLALAAPLTVGGVSVTGSGQSYAALSSVASWQGIELPVAVLAGFDLGSLIIAAPGLSLKVRGSSAVSDGKLTRILLTVAQAPGFRPGLTVFTLQDDAGHSVTFELAVS
jgi:hypothetical protein